MRTFFFILIVASGFQILGYALVDVLLLSGFLFLLSLQNRALKIRVNWVLIFCIYMIFQVLRGMYVLADIRMTYWLIFFITLYFSYQYSQDLVRKNKPNENYTKIIFNFSMIYFVIYGLFPVFIKNPDDFQGIYWVGSSSAFIILIPMLCAHFVMFHRSGYSLSALRAPSLLIYLIVTVLHHSRTGMYLLFLYMAYLFIRSVVLDIKGFNIKRIITISSFFIISIIVLDTTRLIFYNNQESTGATEAAQITGLMDDGFDSEEVAGDINRFLMVISVYDKFISSPKEFLIGSGWYTSRYTLKPYEAATFGKLGLSTIHVNSDKPMQVTAFAAIISDTGLIGLLFMLYFFFKSSVQILNTKSKDALVFLGFLYLNWLFYLVGNVFISIIAFLLIFPGGIIVTLARLTQPSNAYNRKIK